MKLVITFLLALTSFCLSQNFWEKTNWPYSDSGNVLSLVSNSNGDIFAGTADSGVYRSTNKGENWTQINNGLSGLNVGCLAINSNGDIFAGTGLWYRGGYGVFRSTNNGDNWIQINNGLTTPYVWSLAINSNGDIFAGTDDYLFRSMDNGDNWIQLNDGLTELRVATFDVRCFDFKSSGDIFIGTDTGGMYRSTNNGDSWIQINNGLTASHIWSLAINSNEDIFAGAWIADFDTTDNGVYRSTDYGDSWTQINNGLSGLDVGCLAINSNGDIFAGTGLWHIGGDGVFRSTNNGDSWTQTNNGLTKLDVYSLAIDLDGYIYAGTNDGVFRSINSTVTAVEKDKLLPSAFTLYQNYPNPFNPSTTIKYQIPKQVRDDNLNVTLKVYDLLGRERATLVNEKQKPGNYEVKFEGSELTSGVYFYQLTAGTLVETKKLILLK